MPALFRTGGCEKPADPSKFGCPHGHKFHTKMQITPPSHQGQINGGGAYFPRKKDNQRHGITHSHTCVTADFTTTGGEVDDDAFTFRITVKTDGRSKGCEGEQACRGHDTPLMLPKFNACRRTIVGLVHGGADAAIVHYIQPGSV
jgi:hypothetical protein